jgi:dolichol-phosphate mannosyltransferase
MEYSGVAVLHRGAKKGRGSAVIDGLKYALKKYSIRYFLEMDADLAHAPEECRALIDASAHADMVIGSRYLKGSVIADWPMYRLVQSRIINFFLRYLLGLRLTDFTNGFRLYTRPVVEFLVRTPMKEKGFIALSEIAYKVQRHGFRIAEIPVSFKDRKFGSSNANIRELFASLIGAFRIRIG